MIQKILVSIILWGLGNCLNAQSTILVSGTFTDKEVNEILVDLENQYPVRFFFRESELPPEKKTILFKNEPLLKAINRLLDGAGLEAFSFRNFAVIIVRSENPLPQNAVPSRIMIGRMVDTLQIVRKDKESL